jgi:hypothetical protein
MKKDKEPLSNVKNERFALFFFLVLGKKIFFAFLEFR